MVCLLELATSMSPECFLPFSSFQSVQYSTAHAPDVPYWHISFVTTAIHNKPVYDLLAVTHLTGPLPKVTFISGRLSLSELSSYRHLFVGGPLCPLPLAALCAISMYFATSSGTYSITAPSSTRSPQILHSEILLTFHHS